jgi:SET domain-containing protein
MYKPLPPCLTIKKSEIHGLGVFATSNIYAGCDLGIAHVKLPSFPQGYCRTPLGGFYNHSDEPNCILIEGSSIFQHDYLEYWPEPQAKASSNYLIVKRLFTIQDIKCGHEVTCGYTLYEHE